MNKNLEKEIKCLQQGFGLKPEQFAILVNISEQSLYLIKDEILIKKYSISTSKYGIGNKEGSDKTPLGVHYVCEKIGYGAEIGAVFKDRETTGEISKIYTSYVDEKEDLITTRILRLEGLEKGINKGEGIDTYERYVYIHGTEKEYLIGEPASHGCINMRNKDIVELFGMVPKGTLVKILEKLKV